MHIEKEVRPIMVVAQVLHGYHGGLLKVRSKVKHLRAFESGDMSYPMTKHTEHGP